MVGCVSRTRSSMSPAHSAGPAAVSFFPLASASPSLRACRIRRRVESAIACSARSRDASVDDMDESGIARKSTRVNLAVLFSSFHSSTRANARGGGICLSRVAPLLLQNRAVPVRDQPRPHGLCILNIGERTPRHTKQFVGRDRSRYKRGILFLLERVDQCIRVFLFADGSHLHEISRRRRQSRG